MTDDSKDTSNKHRRRERPASSARCTASLLSMMYCFDCAGIGIRLSGRCVHERYCDDVLEGALQ